MSTVDMEVVIDFEILRGRQNEILVKDLSMSAKKWSIRPVWRAPITWRHTGQMKTESIERTGT